MSPVDATTPSSFCWYLILFPPVAQLLSPVSFWNELITVLVFESSQITHYLSIRMC
jgi:hypothetical protein